VKYFLICLSVLFLAGCNEDGSNNVVVTSGSDIINPTCAIVTPEPSTFWLLFFGLGLFLIWKFVTFMNEAMSAEFCEKCIAQGMGAARGFLIKSQCRCTELEIKK
jgi:hypothetical protein